MASLSESFIASLSENFIAYLSESFVAALFENFVGFWLESLFAWVISLNICYKVVLFTSLLHKLKGTQDVVKS